MRPNLCHYLRRLVTIASSICSCTPLQDYLRTPSLAFVIYGWTMLVQNIAVLGKTKHSLPLVATRYYAAFSGAFKRFCYWLQNQWRRLSTLPVSPMGSVVYVDTITCFTHITLFLILLVRLLFQMIIPVRTYLLLANFVYQGIGPEND